MGKKIPALRKGYPRGFDMTLAEVIIKLELTQEETMRLGELTATKHSGIAHATLGHQVYYRSSQIKELFNRC